MGSNGIGKSSWLFNARQRRQHLVGDFLTDVDILLKVLDGFLYRRVGIRNWELDSIAIALHCNHLASEGRIEEVRQILCNTENA